MHRFTLSTVVLAAGAVALVSISAGLAQGTRRPAPGSDLGAAVRLVEGRSERGSIQEAMEDAVARAGRALPGADRMVRYRLRELTGESGGIRGAHSVRIVLEVTDDDARPRPRVDRPAREGAELDKVQVSLQPELRLARNRVDRSESAAFELVVTNTGEQEVTLPFNTGQKYDFEVWRNQRLVWRWSQGRLFTQALTSVELAPGAAATYRATWDLRGANGARVPQGQYEVRAYVTARTDRPRPESTAVLTITGP